MSVRHVFIQRTTRRIAPFNDHVSEILVLHRPLSEWQREAAAALGARTTQVAAPEEIPEDAYPCVLVRDDLFFTGETLREFVRVSRGVGTSTRLRVPSASPYFLTCAPFQEGEAGGSIAYPLEYLAGPGAEPRDVAIDIGERGFPVRLPDHMHVGVPLMLAAVLRPILQLRHAIHVLWANIVAVNVRFAELLASPARQLALAVRARSTDPGRLLARQNRIGRNCRIHRTACLEGAEIGDDVQVGAHALVRMSSVGPGCEIGDGAVVRHCVLGAGTALFDDLNLNFAVTYPDTFLIHGPYNLSVFGRSSAMFATILTDFRTDGKPIRLEVDGELRPYGFPFVGSFIGHRARVAGGSIIAPGRLVPNDVLVYPSPRGVLMEIDPDLPKRVPLAIEDGRLVPVVRAKAPQAADAPRPVAAVPAGGDEPLPIVGT